MKLYLTISFTKWAHDQHIIIRISVLGRNSVYSEAELYILRGNGLFFGALHARESGVPTTALFVLLFCVIKYVKCNTM